MARDPMQMLLAVRRQAVEQARQALAACLAAETAAADKLTAIDNAAQRDRVASGAIAEAHLFTDIFVLRVQTSASERQAAMAALAAAQDVTADARAALVAARTAAEAVETLMTERADAAKAAANQQEQHTLDDMARPRFDSS